MYFGYCKRTGKRGDYKYWYIDDKTKMYYECIKPTDHVIRQFSRKKNHPPKKKIIDCPWRNIRTGKHELIETKEGVLFNKGGIIDKKEIDSYENFHFLTLINELIHEVTPNTKLSIKLINKWHQRFLGQLYSWAGKYRTVEVSKPGFRWPSYSTINNAMNTLDRYMASIMPITSNNEDDMLNIVTKIMSELLFIHPYREGNGRITRLVGSILFVQNNYPIIDLSQINYHDWVNASLDAYAMNYEPLKLILKNAVDVNS